MRVRTATRVAAWLFSGLALGNAWSQQFLTSLPADASPGTLIVNPVTNKIYSINTCCSLQVFDGVTHAVTSIGNMPPSVPQPKVGAIDPISNKVYVGFNVNTSTTKNGLGVIDGATDTLTYLDAGTSPAGNLVKAIAVNPVTHKVYAARDVNEVTVFDTVNANAITRVATTSTPTQIAVNAVTNRTYVGGVNGTITRINSNETIVPIATFGARILSLAVNPVTNKVYAVNDAGQVFEVDGATEAVTSITTVAVISPPSNQRSAIAINPVTNKIYVSDYDGHLVKIIDGATRGVDASPATDTNPGELVVDPVANRIYVTTYSINNVLDVIDGATFAVGQISSGEANTLFYGLAINPVTGRVYASNGFGGTNNDIWVIDRSTYAQAPVSATSVAVVNPVSGKIYLGGQFNGPAPANRTITVLDAATGAVLASIDVTPTGGNMQAMAVDPVLNKVYAVTQGGRFVIVNGASDTAVGTPLILGGDTKDLVVNPVTHRVYVANAGTNAVNVIDGVTNTLLPSIDTIGGSPRIALNAETNRIFAILDRPNINPGNVQRKQVAVIEGATDTLLKIVELGVGGPPQAIAVNPVTNMIYVATQNGGFNQGGALEIVGSTLDNPSPTVNQLPIGVSHGGSVAVNPLTNRVFFGTLSQNVYVFDRTASTVTAVLTPNTTGYLAIDTVRNKVYGTQYLVNGLLAIDGQTLTSTFMDLTGSNGGNGSNKGPGLAVVDGTTGKIYVPCDTIGCDATVVVDPAPGTFTKHRPTAALASGVNGTTSQASPNLTVSIANAYSPSDPATQKLYFHKDSVHGASSTATGTGPYTAGVTGLAKGLNYVSLFALDAMAGTSSSGKYGDSGATPTLTGAPRVFAFVYTGPPAIRTASLPNGKVPNAYSQALSSYGGAGTVTYAVTAGALPNGLALSTAGVISGPPSAAGTFNFTVTATDALGTTGPKAMSITIDPADSILTLNPSTTQDLGSFVVTVSSSPSGITVTNTGGGTLTVGTPTITGTNSGDFGISSNDCVTLAAAASCTINLVFTPSGAGARAAVLTVPNNGAGTLDNQVNLTGTGIAQDTTPNAFAFTDHNNVNRSSVQTSGAEMILGINAPAAISVSGGSYSIGCTATFVTTPSAISNGQTVCVRHTAAAVNSTATNTTLTIGGVSDTFTSTTLPGFTLAVAVSGSGTGTIAGTGIACPGDCSELFDLGTSVSLTATPTGGSAFAGWSGACTGTGACSVSMDAAKSVSAAFSAASPAVSLSSPSLDFGGQSMGTTSPSMPVTITNSGSAALTVSNIAIDNAQFTQTNNCTTVAPLASCTANVSFSPSVAAGVLNAANPASGNLSISSNASGSPHVVTLSGTGQKSLVTHYYRSILRRAPDGGGFTFWQGEAQRLKDIGANVNEAWFAMAQFFYFSAEYTALNRDDNGYVTDLYTTFFNRAPDAGGLNFWVSNLQQGMPREVLLAAFMFSPEFTTFAQAIFGNTAARAEVDAVMDFYRGLLARTPDGSGFDSWVAQFRQAQCQGGAAVNATVEAISSAFATGGEYLGKNRTNAQYVGDLYNSFLRRGGDLGGVQFWINEINTNARSREVVRQNFIASPEFQARVANIVNQGCLP